jgi:hypothetical protein
MISFDDNSGGSTVNLNPIYLSLNALSEQQQTFESDLNNMMIDIQLISNSVSTLTGGGGAEYYITASSDNTDKLSFCYNLKDDITGSTFADIYNNINMNGNSFNENLVYYSDNIKQFNLNGAGTLSSNTFSYISQCCLTGASFSSNMFNHLDNLILNANYLLKNTILNNNMIDITGDNIESMSISNFTNLNIKYQYMSYQTIKVGNIINCNGYKETYNGYYQILLGNLNQILAKWNTYDRIVLLCLNAYSISNCRFTSISNLKLSGGEEFVTNKFSNISTLDFNCSSFNQNNFQGTVKNIIGNAENIIYNTFSNNITRMYLNGDKISSNTFANMTECNINALTLSSNNFATTSTIVIKMLNLTGESIVNNTFGECRLGDIKALTFNSNKITASDYLDFKVDVAEWNTMLVTKLNGIFDGRKNSISAKYGSICGVLSDNTITLNEAKIDGVLAGNAICGEVVNSQTVGTITINHYSGVSDVYNEIYLFDEAHINGNRGRNVYSSIRRLYMDSLTPSDTFEDIQEIIYHGYSNAPASNFVRVGHIYSEVLSQMA